MVLCVPFLCSVSSDFRSFTIYFFFKTMSYALINKYFGGPPDLCVKCCDRHTDKRNPCSRFLKSKYETKLNVGLLYTALTGFGYTGGLPCNID